MGEIEKVAAWLKEASCVVVLTGAGMSTESGVPDFRSKGGWWREMDPMQLATVDALKHNYDVFREFYKHRLESLNGIQPNEGHEVIARLQRAGIVTTIATQNVDGLHTLAGATDVQALHGTLHDIFCVTCGQTSSMQDFLADESCRCGGHLRPNIVLFGEMLPEGAWDWTYRTIQKADVVLVIGTSLQVAPVNQLPQLTQGKKVYINREVDTTQSFDAVLQGSAGTILKALEQALKTLS